MNLAKTIVWWSILLTLALTHSVALANLLVNPSFETDESVDDDLPAGVGDWSGDPAFIVGAENGISPRTGSKILRFDFTSVDGPAFGTTRSDVWQRVSLSPYANEISKGGVEIIASFWVNRVVGDEETDTSFDVLVRAFQGTFPEPFEAESHTTLISDADPTSWEKVSTRLLLPPNTLFVGIDISPLENVVDDGAGVEFHGHYADDAFLTLSIIPEPSAAFLWAACALLLQNGHRRRS